MSAGIVGVFTREYAGILLINSSSQMDALSDTSESSELSVQIIPYSLSSWFSSFCGWLRKNRCQLSLLFYRKPYWVAMLAGPKSSSSAFCRRSKFYIMYISWQISCHVCTRFCLIKVRIYELKSFLMMSSEWKVNPNDSIWLMHWTLKFLRPRSSKSEASFLPSVLRYKRWLIMVSSNPQWSIVLNIVFAGCSFSSPSLSYSKRGWISAKIMLW